MKNNNLSIKRRIENHISKLESKLEIEYAPIPYGGGNPYYKCACCGRSMVETSYDGHYANCKYSSVEGELVYLKNQLKDTPTDKMKDKIYDWFKS